MNSLQRIQAAVGFNPPDRPPVIAQIFGHAAVSAAIPLDEYVQDGSLLARGQLQALDRYGYDAVFTVMDVNVETEALGSTLDYRKNMYPTVRTYIGSITDDWLDLPVPDPNRAGRMPEMLKGIRSLRKELGDSTAIVGCVLGPLTSALQMLGPERTLFLAIDEPELVMQLLDFTTEVAIRFGLAQLEQGAHLPIVLDPGASQAIVPPQFFREFELPHLTRLFGALTAAGAAANWLHIAGPVDAILSYFPQAGVQIANFDYCVSPQHALTVLPRTCLDGNIKPSSFITDTPDEIMAAAVALLDRFRTRGGYILSSGCEIPPESKPENISAMVMAAKR